MTELSAYVLPGTGEQLRIRSVVLRGNLDQTSAARSGQEARVRKDNIRLQTRLRCRVSTGPYCECDSQSRVA
jgi:hypothetical protein